MIIDGKEYLLRHEAAKILGVNKQTLIKWHKAGKLIPKVHPINGIRLYPKDMIEDIIKKLNEDSVK